MWSPGGGELLYRIGDAMMAVAIETEPTLQLGATQQLFEGRYLGDPDRANYDVASNGERFLMVKEPTPQIIFVENWFESSNASFLRTEMTLAPGTTLGPYQVTAKIGEGGMGGGVSSRYAGLSLFEEEALGDPS